MHNFSALKRFLLCLFCVGLLSACCTPQQPALYFTPDDLTATGTKIDAELKSITVNVARDSKTPNEVQLAYRGNNYEQFFKLAVKDALEKSAEKSEIFDDFSDNKLALVATVLKYQTSNSGSQYDTDLILHYQLFNRDTRKLVFAKAIESMGAVVGNNDVLKTHKRFNESRNLAVQANIRQFIASLEDFNGFSKPEKQKHRERKRKSNKED